MNNEEVYKKKYLDALEKARTILEYYKRPEYKDVFDYAKEDLPGIFPELKEQIEDEKMVDMAIKAVRAPEAQSCIKSWGVEPDDVIAWLEKRRPINNWNEVRYTSTLQILEYAKSLDSYNQYGKLDIDLDIEWMKSIRPEYYRDKSEESVETLKKEKKKVVVTNAKTGKFFYATGVVIDKGHYNGRFFQPSLTIAIKDVDVTVPVLGTKYLGDESGVITKKEAIGDNEKIKIQYCSDDGTIEYESTILNAWIREVDRDNGIIQLDCDHVI